ncbi:MAG TPA: ATP-binding protein, partial [Gemmatimonadaceae bacterium]|nr:ATP-binding protein [Gemmatimonadaceae bacterium]
MTERATRRTGMEGSGDDVFVGGGAMGALMRATDWSATSLGSPSAWPQSLRSAVSIMLNSRYPIAVYWGDDLALLYNDAWQPIPGTKHPGALARPAREVWPEIWDTIGPLFNRVITTGEGTWSEDELLPMHRHGYTEECYFNFTFSPIRGEGGRVEGIFNAVVETTFRVIGERRTHVLRLLAERTAGARSAAEACALATAALAEDRADVPFCLIHLAGSGEEASSPWPVARVLESQRGELVTVPEGVALPASPWPEPVRHAYLAPLVVGARPGQPVGVLVLGISPRREFDDEYRAFAEHAASHVSSAIANALAYEAESQRAQALAELDRAKTAFFSNVSHEFRTPLTLMLGPLDELRAGDSDMSEREQQLVELAHRNSLRLLKLVNSLLDFSRIEAGRADAHYEPVDLAAYTTELASAFRSTVERAGLKLEVHAKPLSSPVYVDPDLWEKVVLNLMSNAYKHTFTGEIAVTVRERTGHAELEVRDTGVGIPREQVERVFERFHRVPNARARTHEGSGIGLALVDELVRLHGGSIAVESAVGKGTTFRIVVPLGTAHLESIHVAPA